MSCQQQLQGTTLNATQDLGKDKVKGAHGTGTNFMLQEIGQCLAE